MIFYDIVLKLYRKKYKNHVPLILNTLLEPLSNHFRFPYWRGA